MVLLFRYYAEIKKRKKMFNKKIIVLLSFIGILTTSLYAKQQDPDMVSYKDFVEKKDKHPSKNNIQKKQIIL